MSAELSSRIKQHLLDSIEHMKSIRTCILNEKEALQDRDPDKIEAIAQEKNLLLEKIVADVDVRNAILAGAGFSSDESGMDHLIESLPENYARVLIKGWQQLVSLHEEVQELNQANGMIVNRGLQQVDTMLGVIQSGTGARSAQTYNAKGRSTAPSTRTLGQA